MDSTFRNNLVSAFIIPITQMKDLRHKMVRQQSIQGLATGGRQNYDVMCPKEFGVNVCSTSTLHDLHLV